MKRITILYDRTSSQEESVVAALESALCAAGHQVYVDRHLKISVDWARSVDEKIRNANAVVAVLSANALESEMFEYELEIVNDARLKTAEPRLILVPHGDAASSLGVSGLLAGGYQTVSWQSSSDNAPVIADVLEKLDSTPAFSVSHPLLGSTGGGLASDSPFYIRRDADEELKQVLESGEATVLIKGPRQTGKTSLIAQGIRIVKDRAGRTCVTDFQRLGSQAYASEEDFYRALASSLARQMAAHYDLDWDWEWEDLFGPTYNLDEFIRSMVESRSDSLVWFMDEADWLFSTPYAESFFALVRSWHNSRSIGGEELWKRFSVVIAYATEAHLFIQDINQSPFNVGHRIELKGFTLRQTEELNRRYGEPLRGIDQVSMLQDLLDGQPFLTRTALTMLVRTGGNLRALLASADRDDGPFGDHLRRVLVSVTQLSKVRDAVRNVLRNEFVASSPEVDRLVASGTLVKNSVGNHVFRCKLYRQYLGGHLL